jgi:D-tyrosyl-tRNA(Tyr) deacylase
MRAVIQRVTRARVHVLSGTNEPGSPNPKDERPAHGADLVAELTRPGLCALVGVTHTDTDHHAVKMADRIARLRVLDSLDGQRSVLDLGAPVLVVSQFTLYADLSKGRRPSWLAAAPGPQAEPLIDAVVVHLRALGLEVATGRFGAHMAVELVNDGPMTLLLEV